MVQTQENRRKNPRTELTNTKAKVIMNVGGAIYRTERQDVKVKTKCLVKLDLAMNVLVKP